MNKIIEKTIEKFNFLEASDLLPYSTFAAKIKYDKMQHLFSRPRGKLIIVTSMTPNTKGAGKTTTAIALSEALNHLNHQSIATLRQPSLGPVLGRKGGATGGGKSILFDEDHVNFHFTGDIHAITAAHNAISAEIENEIYFESDLHVDKDRISWPHALDINARSLRDITIHYKGKDTLTHSSKFVISVTSELMSILSLCETYEQLLDRVNNTIIGYCLEDCLLDVESLEIGEAIAKILKDAFLPNFTLTNNDTPVLVHGGAFANIAHGTTSKTAIKTGLSIADYVICETGFGADLGLEKFCHILALNDSYYNPDGVVLVVSVPMIKSLENGYENIAHHISSIHKMNIPVTISCNVFAEDTPQDHQMLKNFAEKHNVSVSFSDPFNTGYLSCIDLARNVLDLSPLKFNPLYNVKDSIETKVKKIAINVYGADDVTFSQRALNSIDEITDNGWSKYSICVAKSPFELLPPSEKTPKSFLFVEDVEIKLGAQFIIIYISNIITMPGLPRQPLSKSITLK